MHGRQSKRSSTPASGPSTDNTSTETGSTGCSSRPEPIQIVIGGYADDPDDMAEREDVGDDGDVLANASKFVSSLHRSEDEAVATLVSVYPDGDLEGTEEDAIAEFETDADVERTGETDLVDDRETSADVTVTVQSDRAAITGTWDSEN